MEFTRNLKKGASGEDVLFCKRKLLELGCYAANITAVTKNVFGPDTVAAVKRFQAQVGLTVDGVIGEQTWAALFGDTATGAEPDARTTSSDKAKAICALALTRIGDLYVWGASGLKDLSDSKIKAMDTEYARVLKFRDAQYKAASPNSWRTIAPAFFPGCYGKRASGIRAAIATAYGRSAMKLTVVRCSPATLYFVLTARIHRMRRT